MANVLHKNLLPKDMHPMHAWKHSSKLAREAQATTVADVGKISWQEDENTFWWLAASGPNVWVKINEPVLTPYTYATRPIASAEWRGRFIAIKDAGLDEELHYCRQLGDGSYTWSIVAF